MAAVLTALAILLFITPAAASTPLPVVDTTITVKESGTVHVKVIKTVPDNFDGAVNYHFDLHKESLDHAISETDTGNNIRIMFHNVSNAGADYAWEVRFGAKGIDDEVCKPGGPCL